MRCRACATLNWASRLPKPNPKMEAFVHNPAYGWVKAGESDVAVKTSNPQWDPFIFKSKRNVVHTAQVVELRVWNSNGGNKSFMGSVQLPFSSFRSAKGLQVPLHISGQGDPVGNLTIVSVYVQRTSSKQKSAKRNFSSSNRKFESFSRASAQKRHSLQRFSSHPIYAAR